MLIDPRAANPPLVLIVDDNEDGRDMYAIYLEHVGLRVATAGDGKAGVDQARALRPDVVVMDLTMPGMDGLAATRAMRADAVLHDTPIIALTGHALKSTEQRAREAGCDRYLMKPCLPEHLVAVIAELLDRGRRSHRRPA
jgi:two-component system cell cycle response regulator DivK